MNHCGSINESLNSLIWIPIFPSTGFQYMARLTSPTNFPLFSYYFYFFRNKYTLFLIFISNSFQRVEVVSSGKYLSRDVGIHVDKECVFEILIFISPLKLLLPLIVASD